MTRINVRLTWAISIPHQNNYLSVFSMKISVSWSEQLSRKCMISLIIDVWKKASITASATFGHSAWRRRPPTPLASGAEVLWPRTEAAGVADALIKARNWAWCARCYGKNILSEYAINMTACFTIDNIELRATAELLCTTHWEDIIHAFLMTSMILPLCHWTLLLQKYDWSNKSFLQLIIVTCWDVTPCWLHSRSIRRH